MLRNSTVGTKLMAVILPPLLVLVGITAYGVQDRFAVAHRAEDASFAVSMLWAGRQLTSELQIERMWSALLLEGLPVSNELSEQQAITDRSWTLYLTLAAQVTDDVVYQPMVERSVTALRDLQSVRSSIQDSSRDLFGAFDWYGNAINQIISMGTGAVGSVPDAQGSLDLSTYVSYALAQEAYAKRATNHLAAQGAGSFDAAGKMWRLERSANNRAFQQEQLLYSSANPAQTEAYNDLLNSAEVQRSLSYQDGIFELIRPSVNQGDGTLIAEPVLLTPEVVGQNGPVGQTSPVTPIEFIEIVTTQLSTLDQFGAQVLTSVDESVHASHANAKNTAWKFIVGALAGLVISALLALLLTRRITRPIRKLNKDARELATEQVPALLEKMKSPEGLPESTELKLLSSARRDELGQLARSFDRVQTAVLEVAEEQSALLHKGISDMFVNIARRNQSLIDRQIEFIDQLETKEKDPELLESLYKLDHLATQIRRNDESLLVLAGVETGLRRSRPVELRDVIRMAMGEIEEYPRVKLERIDPVLIMGNAASNVAHILAELMENATTFSPPESPVVVQGVAEDDGTYTIAITDHGIGMTQDQINHLNALLKEPPLVGLSLNRDLGLAITARLAVRLGATVVLSSTATGGVEAVIKLPSSIVPKADPLADQALPPRAFRPAIDVPAIDRTTGVDSTPTELTSIATEPTVTKEPPKRALTLVPSAKDDTDHLVEKQAESAQYDLTKFTEAGLVRRKPLPKRTSATETPPATAPPAMATSPSETKTDVGTELGSGPDIGAREEPAEAGGAKRSQRSPEEVREMLSRYRSGLRQGQSAAATPTKPTNDAEDPQ